MQQVALHEALCPHGEVWRLELYLTALMADAEWVILSKDEGKRALRFGKFEDRPKRCLADRSRSCNE